MFKKAVFTTLLATILMYGVQAQGVDYKTYSIQVASFSKVLGDKEFNVVLKKFNKLSDLGYVYEKSYLSPTNMVPSKFYLGSYIGMHTAKRILRKVKARGYRDAYIVEEIKAANPSKTKHFEVVQLGAYGKLHMNNFKKLSNDVGQGYVAVVYSPKERSYKVVLTSFNDGDRTDELKDAKDYGFKIWKRDIRHIYQLKSAKKKK